MPAATKSSQTGGTVIYCRISLDKTGAGLGVERQERECRDLVEAHGWSLAKVFVDNDISATTGKIRPAFLDLLNSNPERIVVWHIDRLVRLTNDLERVIALAVNVHAVTAGHLDLSNPAGRAVARTVTAWAQYEGEQKGERQRAQQRQRIDAGRSWWSQRPFGYEQDGTLRGAEAQEIKAGYERMLTGTAKWVNLSKALNDAGLTTSKGNAWTPTTTAQLYRSPRNAGLIESNGEIVGQGQWQAIVSKEQWHAALALTGDRSQLGLGQGTRKGMLSGIATCSGCQRTVYLRTRSAKARGDRKLYGCPVGHATAPVGWLDEHVGKAIVKRLLSPASTLAFGNRDGGERHALTVKADGFRSKLHEVGEMFLANEITREQMGAMTKALRTQLVALETDIDRAYWATPLGDIAGPASALAAWRRDDMALDERRAIVTFLLKAIEIRPRRRGERMAESHVQMTWRRW